MVDDKLIWDVIAGRISFYALVVSLEVGLFESLAKLPKSLSELSRDLELEERAIETLTLMVLNLGFVRKYNKKYHLTDVSKRYLLNSSETYFGNMLELSSKNSWGYEELKKSVLLNTPFIYGGEEIFDTHLEDIERCERFTNAMHSVSMSSALHWPDKIDLSSYKTFLDVGGGSGAHIIGALKTWTHMNAILLDIPNVIKSARKFIEDSDLLQKVEFVEEDFWKCKIPKADIHFYSQIFHDWPIEKCKYLAERSFNALPDNGLIIVHEILFNDDKSGPTMAAAGNVGMLAWTEGKQYSGEEISEILKTSGFKSIEIIPTFSYWSIVVGLK